MAEIYSIGERILIYAIIAAFAIAGPLIYLCCRINRNKVSWYIFVICLIYSALFVFLNIIAMFDLCFSNQKGFENFSKVISKYYEAFDYIDKILGFLIFPLIINFLESGHYSVIGKILDSLFGIIYELYETLILSFKIILFVVILIIIIVKRKYFGLGKNPFDYLFIILDCYAIVDIYIYVGFFMVQIFVDCKTQKNKQLSDRYYRYSVIKIIEKTEKYISKMNNLSETLNKTIKNYNKDKSSPKYINLKNTSQKIENQLKQYQSDISVNYQNNNFQNLNQFNYSSVQINQTNNYYENNNNININNNINNYYNNNMGGTLNYLNNTVPQNFNNERSETNNQFNLEGNQVQNIKISNNKTEKEKEKKKLSPVDCKKKYKKYIRRIDRLKLLYKAINDEFNPNNKTNRKCRWYNIIFFIAFGIAVLSDIILPIGLNLKDEFANGDKNFEKEKNTFALIVGVILAVALSVVTSSYTIITIYSSKRRRYISGDYLYDKKINDNLSLLKTVQLICGFSFAILYCNLYFWRTIDKTDIFGRPIFYNQVIIPDYIISHGISVYMIVKVIIIIISIFAALRNTKLNKISSFKNDLTKYNSNICGQCIYDNDSELNRVITAKIGTYNLLNYQS
jgi:hypothetical protein